eukprot:31421-Pelagococcus_subviridis.AAC.6
MERICSYAMTWKDSWWSSRGEKKRKEKKNRNQNQKTKTKKPKRTASALCLQTMSHNRHAPYSAATSSPARRMRISSASAIGSLFTRSLPFAPICCACLTTTSSRRVGVVQSDQCRGGVHRRQKRS